MATLTVALLTSAVSTQTASAAPAKPKPTATFSAPDRIRADKQTDDALVTVTGIPASTRITVGWGDEGGRVPDHQNTACSSTAAAKRPSSCSLEFAHYYAAPGTYIINVLAGKKPIAQKTIQVTQAPVRWTPPAGFAPSGWAVLNGGATYFPCQNVTWFWDSANQPADRGQLKSDAGQALAMLSAETGLTFTETPDKANADLIFDWDPNLESTNKGAAGIGGGSRNGKGAVTLNPVNWWTTDSWPGFGIVTQPDGSYALGHGWLIVHETMHVLGMDHVNDTTAVMNPIAGATALNAGDLAGLHTMYRDQPCVPAE